MQDTIEREIFIEAPIDRVWAAITQAEHLSKWLGDRAEIDLRPGGAITFGWPHEPSEDCVALYEAEVETVEPPHRFAFQWRDHGWVDEGSTRVEFTLVSDGSGTRLTLVESGFAGLGIGTEKHGQYINTIGGGWSEELNDLAQYLGERPA